MNIQKLHTLKEKLKSKIEFICKITFINNKLNIIVRLSIKTFTSKKF